MPKRNRSEPASSRRRVVCLAVAMASATVQPGCTLLFPSVTAFATRSRETKPLNEAWKIVTVKPGEEVGLVLRDGETLDGTYGGLVRRTPEEYAQAYALAQEKLPGELPTLGAGVRVKPRYGPETTCHLIGMTYGSVLCRNWSRGRLPLEEVTRIEDVAGRGVDGKRLRELVRANTLPLVEAIALDGDSGRAEVPLEKVLLVDRPDRVTSNRATKIALAVVAGLAIDALIILALQEAPPPPESQQSSCPYAYSFDGKGYVLDAEPFGGAFVEAAQRSDWSRLDNLREHQGGYRVRLANELQEVDHVDEVKLLVVDHPTGSSIAPSLFGRQLTVSHPITPSRALDLTGANVLPLVARADDRVWLGNPFGRDPSRPEDLRDGLEIEFPRPAGSTSVTLVVRSRGSAWAPELLHHVLELKGRDLGAWYQRLSVEPAARGALRHLVVESVPTIRVWNGRSWSNAGFLTAMSTETFTTQAVPLTLPTGSDAAVRVRIDGLPGTWMVDSLALEPEQQAPIQVSELLPAVARTHLGEDVREALARADGRRHVIEKGERVDLEFAAPPLAAGLSRSFVLKATGYYTILLPPGGEPQTARFERLLSEPGAVARYSIELLQGLPRQAVRAD
jgi:hypothetical protein